jgi:tetratricopeptide (TPR) repeat protein
MTDQISRKICVWAGSIAVLAIAGCYSPDAPTAQSSANKAAESDTNIPRELSPIANAKPISAIENPGSDSNRAGALQQTAAQVPLSNPYFKKQQPTEREFALPDFDFAMSATRQPQRIAAVTNADYDPGISLAAPQQNNHPAVNQSVRELPKVTATQRNPAKIKEQLAARFSTQMRELPLANSTPSKPKPAAEIFQAEDFQPVIPPTLPEAPSPAPSPEVRPLPIDNDDMRIGVLERLASKRHAADAKSKGIVDPLAGFTPANMALPAAISARTMERVKRGNQLAKRRAFFSAEADFIDALRIVARGNDAITQNSQEQHLIALNQALTALTEANDFVNEVTLQGDRLFRLVEVHQTPVLKNATVEELSTGLALEEYHRFARRRLIQAAGSEPVAAEAFYRLGKLQAEMAKESTAKKSLGGAKALVLYDAALVIQPNHALAANELGVALAKLGKLTEARQILAKASRSNSHGEIAYNLAVVDRALGYNMTAPQLAQGPPPAMDLEWVAPSAFGSQPVANAQFANPQLAQRQQNPAQANNLQQQQNTETPWWQVWRRNSTDESRR